MTRQSNAGEGIREKREAVGLSKEGLAYKAGVALSTIDRIESGAVTPRRATLAMIEQALDAEQKAPA